VGQALEGAVVVQEKLDGKTGPKVWVDCGVGLYKKNDWMIQTAMLRLGNTKASVAAKKAARLRNKKHFPVYVSRIRLENDQLEVTLEPELIPKKSQSPLIRLKDLQVGQELSGIIQRVEDYGLLINVGANRSGLLHIRRVGDLYQKFVNQADGLKKVGLHKGVQVDVQVISCEKKRLFLDFSKSLKQEAERKYKVVAEDDPYTEEAALFAEQRQQQQHQQNTASPALMDEDEEDDYDEEEDDEDDDYDEDREIEDAMGLGRY
jgi:predicted RNA-binding protein with RPS1 domain